jgi:hypothetical protein
MGRDRSVSVVTGYRVDERDSIPCRGKSSFRHRYQTLIHSALSLAREADHSPPPSTEVKNECNFTSPLPDIFTTWRRPRRRWEDNIKLYLRVIGIDGANWTQLAQDRVQWRAFVSTVMNLRVL